MINIFIAGSMRPMVVNFPQTVDDHIEDQIAASKREVMDDDEGLVHKDVKKARKGKSPAKGRSNVIHESQLTVPETPTPEQIAAEAKRKEYAIASGRLSAIEDAVDSLPEGTLAVGKKRKNKRRLSVGKLDLKTVVMQTTGHGTSSMHKEICIMAAEQFGKIRQLLVERTIDTLNEAFLDPL